MAFAAACFAILAPWQLGKNSDTEHRNDLIRAATGTAPVPIDELAPPGSSFDADHEWREVTLRGRYLVQGQVLLRFRYSDERPAVEALTPFQISGSDRIIVVNRGIVPSSTDGTFTIPTPPDGDVTISARLMKSEGTSPGKEPRVENGAATAYTIDTAQLAKTTGMRLESFYVQLSPQQPGSLGEIELPQLESGPYLSYGLQWLAFGVMVPLGAGYFIYNEVKARRAKKASPEVEAVDEPVPTAKSERERFRRALRETGQRSGNDVSAKTVAGVGEGAADSASDDAVRAKLAARYGK
ncbi:SURF1-like protein [Gordonia spumicola]|uniref:SURF1-like protein n=1 Tax=Gordonia spumicola TaxID=589161 RepID=A0A7I9VDJ7_9ACTN|nr:SURF1-like protein [Gordonia spumicola]